VAFDIAGKSKADPSSFLLALYECIDIINRRKGYAENRKNPLRKASRAMLANAKDEAIED
jgi:4-hydroxythreonine-4-phosphate dehydrogenase